MATVAFGPLTIAFDDERLLVPRPWTIEQSRWAVEVATSLPDGPVLELCCGAGQIGLVVAVETGRRLVQVDDLPEACAYARHNAAIAGVEVDVRCARVEDAIVDDERGRFPLILADPPYVPSDRTGEHAGDPQHTIDGGGDGLDVARRCLAVARRAVAPDGIVILQTGGAVQAETLATTAGFGRVDVRELAVDRALLLLRAPTE